LRSPAFETVAKHTVKPAPAVAKATSPKRLNHSLCEPSGGQPTRSNTAQRPPSKETKSWDRLPFGERFRDRTATVKAGEKQTGLMKVRHITAKEIDEN